MVKNEAAGEISRFHTSLKTGLYNFHNTVSHLLDKCPSRQFNVQFIMHSYNLEVTDTKTNDLMTCHAVFIF